MKLLLKSLSKTTLILLVISLIFSFWLMFHTFSYNQGSIEIASKAWSDFAAHIPLIRSFSFGNNFPPEYPIFSGEPIKYHFLFYLLVGYLEKTGLSLDFALNIPSALSFTFLMLTIYFFAKTVFQSKAVGILALVFFIFNGSFSFLEFFKIHPLSFQSIQDIISNTTFPSFGPYDGKEVSAFWNLNIYTNQRHLALSFAVSLLLILFVSFSSLDRHKIKYSLLAGLILGLFFFFHFAVFLMTVVVLVSLFLLLPKKRLSIFVLLGIAAILILPQYLYLQSNGSNFKLSFIPGYLIFNNLTIERFFGYWLNNLGLHLILIPFGFILAPSKAKKILLAFIPIFVIGNTLQFSPEMAGNHKFFNYFMLIGVIFSAYYVIYLWNRKNIFRSVVPVLIFLLIFSGLIDLFPIINDRFINFPDYPLNKNVQWIKNSTPPNSVFLNSSYLYDPASLAGRKIFLGWPYFAWSAGYDTDERKKIMTQILTSEYKDNICYLLQKNNISYVEIQYNDFQSLEIPSISYVFLTNFKPEYVDSNKEYFIYNTTKNCR